MTQPPPSHRDGTEAGFVAMLQLGMAEQAIAEKVKDGLPTTWRDHLMVRVRRVCAIDPREDTDLAAALLALESLARDWQTDLSRRHSAHQAAADDARGPEVDQ